MLNALLRPKQAQRAPPSAAVPAAALPALSGLKAAIPASPAAIPSAPSSLFLNRLGDAFFRRLAHSSPHVLFQSHLHLWSSRAPRPRRGALFGLLARPGRHARGKARQ